MADGALVIVIERDAGRDVTRRQSQVAGEPEAGDNRSPALRCSITARLSGLMKVSPAWFPDTPQALPAR